jgi:hypothetical protein
VFLMGGAPLIGYAIGSLFFARFRFGAADHARAGDTTRALPRASRAP